MLAFSSRFVSFLNPLPWPRSDTQVLQAAKDIGAGQEALINVFIRVQYYFKRLEIYTNVPATDAMRNMMVDIMVEVISFLAIATKEVKRGRASQSISGINRGSQLTYLQKNI